jgi:hypothetical protein
MRTTLAIAISLALLGSPALAGDDPGHKLISKRQVASSKRLCEKTWPAKKRPPVSMTDRCLQYWLFAYNYDRPASLAGVEDALSMDPIPAGGAGYTASQFRAMAAHVRRAFPGENGWLVQRALELFDASAATYTSFFDMNLDVEGALVTILAGKPYTAELEGASAPTLWLLRNAVYARHGRKFKHPDLNHYFYGAFKRPAAVRRVLPRRIDPRFSDRMLTAVDRRNVRRIAAEEKEATASDR